MKDWWHALTKLADYHRGTLLALAIVAALAAYLVGCDVTTSSLIAPGTTVTPRQLDAEVRQVEAGLAKQRNRLVADVADFNDQVAHFNQATDAALADLQSQQEIRSQIIETIGGFAADAVAGQFNPLSAISALVTLIAAGTATGLAVDTVRKNRVIKLLKDRNEANPETQPAT